MPRENDSSLRVRSVAFSQGGHIPPKYTCEGDNVNPPLESKWLPGEYKIIGHIVEDPDAPKGVYDHWLVWNIPPNETIAENSKPGVVGRNSFGNVGYGGPCPPSGSHRYFFKVYALDTQLDIEAGADKERMENAMKDHVVASGELMAYYQKRK